MSFVKKNIANENCLYRLVGAVSGLLLAAPQLYAAMAPTQAIALLPILFLAATGKVHRRGMLLAGMYMGLAYTIAQLIVLRLPISMTLILLVYLTVLMMVLAWASAQLLRGPAVAGAFAVGAMLVVLDWVNFTAVPIWGTAQSFVRPWSRYPNLVLFVSFTGITGIIFVLGTLQAMTVNFIKHPKARIRLLLAAAAVVLFFTAANITIRYRQPAGSLKVAAVGWTSANASECGETYSPKGFDTLFAQPIAIAADQGAKLVVSPEIGFYIDKNGRHEWFERFSNIANRHKVFLAIGYLNLTDRENRLVFISSEGIVLAEYTKTYLTCFEDFNKGSGHLKIIDVNGTRVGGLICQDDNFPSLSREYGRKQTAIVAIPTLDWSTVKDAHLQNSIHRAIESRYAVVRAALNGISAIVSPIGEPLAYKDHFLEGPGVIVADVPVYKTTTLFSSFGHWPVVPSVMFLIIYIMWNLFRPRFRNQMADKYTEEHEKLPV